MMPIMQQQTTLRMHLLTLVPAFGAFDRAKMLNGDVSASAQRFTLGNTNKFFSMCPVLWQGTTTPAAGTGGLMGYPGYAWTASTKYNRVF